MPYQKKKIVPINYTSRDFDSIKRDLIDYAKRYYPDTYRDFNEASFGALMVDTVSYVGDILSFYLDYQANESFLDTAIEYDNVVRLTRQLGYNFRGAPVSTGLVTFYIVVPSSASGIGPDRSYLPILKTGSKFATPGGIMFTLSGDVDFSRSSNEIVVATVNSDTGVPTGYAVKASGLVVSGELAVQSSDVAEYRRFRRIKLTGTNISEIVSVVDDAGNEYFEVDHLSQNVIYRPIVNRADDKQNAPFIMKPFAVPRRFIVIEEGGNVFIQFGYGSEDNLTNEKIVDPSKVVLNQHGKDHITDNSFDPSVLIETDKFGVAPSSTTLQIVYRVNGAGNVNISAGALTQAVQPSFTFSDSAALDIGKMSDVMASLEFENLNPIVGDVTAPTVEELKSRAYSTFSSQNRAVTKQDYQTLVYNMPGKFGAVKRTTIVRDADSFKRNLNMYVISEDVLGNLTQTTETIKKNVKTWLSNYKMINDTIDILDAKIVNLGIEFEIIADLESEKHEVLDRASRAIKTRMLRSHFDIGEPLRTSDVFKALQGVNGILDVVNVKITNKLGDQYNTMSFNIDLHTSPDGRLIIAPEDVIFEIKYPDSDIIGTVR